jgi:hypothetical protein
MNLSLKNTQSRLLAHHHNQGWMLYRHNSLRELTRQKPEKLHGTTANQDQRSSLSTSTALVSCPSKVMLPGSLYFANG